MAGEKKQKLKREELEKKNRGSGEGGEKMQGRRRVKAEKKLRGREKK